jgi:hypothetical protein
MWNRSAKATTPQGNSEPPTLRENTSSDTGAQATAPTAAIWPDPPPVPSINAREVNAVAANVPWDPASDTTDSAARIGERTSEFEIPILVFPALAIGLVVIGFGARLVIKDAGTRRTQTVDRTEAGTISDQSNDERLDNRRADGTREEDNFQSFVSAVSGHGPLQNTPGPIQATNDISAREARLAQLRKDVDRRLRWPEPTRARPPKQKVAC